MPKLQTNSLGEQRVLDREMIAMGRHKGNLYEMSSTKVHSAKATNFIQSLKRNGTRELGHLNVKSVHVLQSLVSGMNLGKIHCPTFSLVCKICIEGQQLWTMLFQQLGTTLN